MSDDRAPGQPRTITHDELLALRAEHAADGPAEFARVMRWATGEMDRGRAMDAAAEVVAHDLAQLSKAERRKITAVEVRCERCTKDGLLLRVVKIPAHIEQWGGWLLAIPSTRTQSRFRSAQRARWLLVEAETWHLECRTHAGQWLVGWEHLAGETDLPGLSVGRRAR